LLFLFLSYGPPVLFSEFQLITASLCLLPSILYLQAGVTAKETSGGDFSYDLFGRLQRSLRGWLYDARLDTSSTDLNKINAAFRITAPSRTVLSVDGLSNVEEQSLHLTSFGVEQPFVAKEVNGVVRIRCPAVPISSSSSSETTSLQVDCAYRDTLLSLDGTKHRQAMTVVQSFRGRHEIGPTITSDGLWQISYACALPKDKGAVIGTYRPDGAVSLEYRGGPLSLSLDVPLKGYYQIEEGARLSFRQTISS
jgi:hypothetical protein